MNCHVIPPLTEWGDAEWTDFCRALANGLSWADNEGQACGSEESTDPSDRARMAVVDSLIQEHRTAHPFAFTPPETR